MFTHPSILAPLLGLGFALVWAVLRPGSGATAVALGCAAVLIWMLQRQARAERDLIAARVARLEAQCEAERAAREHSEAARREAEADLRATEERYLLALRGSQDGLWEWDLRSDVVHLSPRWKSMLGFETDEIADTRAGWLGCVHAEDRGGLEAALERHLGGTEPRFDLALRLRRKDGSTCHVLSRAVAIRSDNGTPLRMVGLDTDVTEVRRMQSVLEAVADGTSGVSGDRFFQAMVQHFARALEVERAFITECADAPVTRVRTLAVWSARGGQTENFEYALAGTPCAAVVEEGRVCFHRHGLSQRFPREAGYESFLGLPIVGSDGRLLGHLAFFDTRPRGDDLLVDAIFRIFLARAAAEMERCQALRRLAASDSMHAARA